MGALSGWYRTFPTHWPTISLPQLLFVALQEAAGSSTTRPALVPVATPSPEALVSVIGGWGQKPTSGCWVPSSLLATHPTQPTLMITYPCSPCPYNTLPSLTLKSTGALKERGLTRMFFSCLIWLKLCSFHKAPLKMPRPSWCIS